MPLALPVINAFHLAVAALTLLAAAALSDIAAAAPGERQHLIFGKGTPQELDVFKIYGRESGPTVMIMGGIQGDEPGGFLSADPYADLCLKKGNLIVVPRANFRSVVLNNRGPFGDMNRKFEDNLPDEPELKVVNILKSLMAESDLLLNLHDGSGFYRPVWESDMLNPKRYGQSIIADTAVYVRESDGRTLDLKKSAEEVIARLNNAISEPLYKYHFFNMETTREDTQFREQRKSATYYALTRLGIPAFGIETSKQLPSLEMKIHHHILAVNAFLDIFGVEVEHPGIILAKPALGYVLIAVNDSAPIAAASGQTLMLAPGDTIEVLHVSANYERGLSVEVKGFDGLNDLNRPLKIEKPTTILVRRDNATIGQIPVALLSEKETFFSPRLLGANRAFSPRQGTVATLDTLSGAATIARLKSATAPRSVVKDSIQGFLVEVDGKPVQIPPGGQLDVTRGSRVKLVDIKTAGEALPKEMVMNLKGFVPKPLKNRNTGEDRGYTADTAQDMMPAFSEGRGGEVYAINAELGKQLVASCSLRIIQPRMMQAKAACVSIRYLDKTRTLSLGSRVAIPAGTQVELLEFSSQGSPSFPRLRFTLAGHALPAKLPQSFTMRDIAINLAVFNDNTLIGKVTLLPQ
jgi:hypothetical protein